MGNIIIKDNATLLISGSVLELSNGTEIELSGNGQLVMVHSRINFTGNYAAVNAFNSSRIILDESEVVKDFWCQAHQGYHYLAPIDLYNDTKLVARDSKIGWLRASERSLSLVDNCFLGYMEIDQKTSAYAKASNSTIAYLSPQSGTCVIEESTVRSMGLYLVNGSYSCRFYFDEYVESWNSEKDGAGIPCDLTLQSTSLEEFYVSASNCLLKIRDSRPQFISFNDCSSVTVTNCTTDVSIRGNTIDAVEIIDCNIATLDLETVPVINKFEIERSVIGNAGLNLAQYTRVDGSRVGKWWTGSYYAWDGPIRLAEISDSSFGNFTINLKSSYNFSNVTVKDRTWFMYSYLNEPTYLAGPSYISGGVTFQNRNQVFEYDLLSDTQYLVTRQYDVLVTRGGYPLAGASLRLQSGNRTIWSGEPYIDGRARFNVTYTGTSLLNQVPGQPPLLFEENMTRTLTLLVEDHGDSTSTSLSLLSDSPIVVGFGSVLSGSQRQLIAISFSVLLVLVTISVLITRKHPHV